jgi:hypothetical protein
MSCAHCGGSAGRQGHHMAEYFSTMAGGPPICPNTQRDYTTSHDGRMLAIGFCCPLGHECRSEEPASPKPDSTAEAQQAQPTREQRISANSFAVTWRGASTELVTDALADLLAAREAAAHAEHAKLREEVKTWRESDRLEMLAHTRTKEQLNSHRAAAKKAQEALNRILERRDLDCGEHEHCCQCKMWPHDLGCASQQAWKAGVAALAALAPLVKP